MTIDEIKELIHLVKESGIAELEVQRGEDRVRIQRSHPSGIEPGTTTVYANTPQPLQSSNTIAPPPSQISTEPATAASAKEEAVLVKSPIVGTFYEAPSPGTPPFVRIGDKVSPGDVLCIIESMKLMNEIEAEVAGTIVSKLVENGRPVEYGEALFGVKPS
jgi:acetyl-CoA carboxylase biotin carboxyl carrier protein